MRKLKKYLPKSLLGRFILIFILPVILAQMLAIYVFFYFYVDVNSRNISRLYVSQISSIKDAVELNSSSDEVARYLKYSDLRFYSDVRGFLKLNKIDDSSWQRHKIYSYFNLFPIIDPYFNFKQVLRGSNLTPFEIFETSKGKDSVVVSIKSNNKSYYFEILKKRIHSSSKYVFILWMVFAAFLTSLVAIIFLKNQLRPIGELCEATKSFGKGRYDFSVKPSGSSEVRALTRSFKKMADRVSTHISQRTDMLSGVSHDLRTPLTRMKLSIEMSGQNSDLKEDIKDMEDLIEEYLDFAKNQEREVISKVKINEFLKNDVLSKYIDKKSKIRFKSSSIDDISVNIRKFSYKRALINLIENALKYGNNVNVESRIGKSSYMVVVDDDGPGIPKELRSRVLEPFYRVDESRNLDKGSRDGKSGSGLGLSIANDAIASQGGKIRLFDSPLGGLRVIIFIPIN